LGRLIPSTESRQAVEHERTGHRDVQAGPLADHRDLDHFVDEIPDLERDSAVLVTKENHSPLPCRRKIGQADGVLRELDGEDPAPPLAFISQPSRLRR
jgi:hypothetical protein